MRGMGVVNCRASANEKSCAHHVTWSPNKLWRSNSIFNLSHAVPFWFSVKGKPKLAVKNTNFVVKEENELNIILLRANVFLRKFQMDKNPSAALLTSQVGSSQ